MSEAVLTASAVRLRAGWRLHPPNMTFSLRLPDTVLPINGEQLLRRPVSGSAWW